MISSDRHLFNKQYSSKKNLQFQFLIQKIFDFKPGFKVLETPVFISNQLKTKLIEASESIVQQLQSTPFRMIAHQAIPPQWQVPNEDEHPLFLQFDFAITLDKYQQPEPQLIEMQGFPSLFFFHHAAWWAFQSTYELSGYTPYFGDMTTSEYMSILRKAILNNHEPKETILLEINPWQQRTALDFAGANALLDIPVCDINDIILKEKKIYYRNNRNKLTQIKRIFNRVILDELFRKAQSTEQFNLLQEVEVEWAGHPNWFLKYSKFALPYIQGDYCPKSIFLNDWNEQEDLKNYVLKPTHSFAGNGILLNPIPEDLKRIKNKDRYILQRKVVYAPVLLSPKGTLSKIEIRVMLIQDPNNKSKYKLMSTLVRSGQSNTINTQPRGQEWTGGGIGLFS